MDDNQWQIWWGQISQPPPGRAADEPPPLAPGEDAFMAFMSAANAVPGGGAA